VQTGIEVVNLLLQKNGLQGQKIAYDGGIQILEKWQALGIIWGAVTE
jgi:hypothetical protein